MSDTVKETVEKGAAQVKKPYQAPELVTYGNIADLTATIGNSNIRDTIGGAFNKSM
jgi:hypothetical protein